MLKCFYFVKNERIELETSLNYNINRYNAHKCKAQRIYICFLSVAKISLNMGVCVSIFVLSDFF